MYNAFAQHNHVIPVLAPADIASTATNTTHVKVTGHKVQFWISFGAITGDSVAVTVEASTAATTTGAAAIGFNYRLSGAVATDTWDAVTTADSTGVDVTATDDNKILLVEPILQEMGEDDQYLSVLLSPGASMSALLVGAHAVQYSRYPQLNHVSAT